MPPSDRPRPASRTPNPLARPRPAAGSRPRAAGGGRGGQPPRCLAAALEYRDRGWSVIPLCPPDHDGVAGHHAETCSAAGKRPLIPWEEYQGRPATAQEILEWWARWPAANVGVVCGPVSGLIGLDVDGEPGEALLAEIAGGEELPPSWEFLTGRPDSRRILYRLPMGHPAPQSPVRNEGGASALTVIGQGGQTVMPPSLHRCGAEYRWAVSHAPTDLDLEPAPDWLLRFLADRARAENARENTRPPEDGGPIVAGGRNEALTKLAGSIRRFGATQAEILTLLTAVNAARCQPPLSAAEVQTISRSVARYAPHEYPGHGQMVRQTAQTGAAVLIPMRDVEPREIRWVWPNWIPSGALVCLDGDGGVGKSTVALDLAARLTRGGELPDGSRPTAWQGAADVLLVCCEDSLEATIRPRVEAAGCDLNRVHYLENVRDPFTGQDRMLSLPDDIPALEAVIRERRIRLVVIDPILAFMGGSGDYSKDQDVRRTIGPLKRIADEHGCTFLYIRHWNKGSAGAQASYRGGGSLAWVNVARAAFCCGRSPDLDGHGEFHWTKSNLAPPQQGWVYRTVPVSQGVTRIEWVGRSTRTADDIARPEGRTAEEREDAANAADWLRGRLADGPADAQRIEQEFRRHGFDRGAFRPAARRAGAVFRWETDPTTGRTRQVIALGQPEQPAAPPATQPAPEPADGNQG